MAEYRLYTENKTEFFNRSTIVLWTEKWHENFAEMVDKGCLDFFRSIINTDNSLVIWTEISQNELQAKLNEANFNDERIKIAKFSRESLDQYIKMSLPATGKFSDEFLKKSYYLTIDQDCFHYLDECGLTCLTLEAYIDNDTFPIINKHYFWRDWRQNLSEPLTFLEDEARSLYLDLVKALQVKGKLAVAFSGGVDSTLILYVASRALGNEQVMGVLGISPFTPKREINAAKTFTEEYGLPLGTASFSDADMESLFPNPVDRCYHCKKMLFTNFLNFAKNNGYPNLAEGSNLDDLGDYRPGLKAIEELQVLSPLRIAGFDKRKIRFLSAALGLPTKDMPSLACLATRMPYNQMIKPEILVKIDLAEEFLLNKGFKQVRVRAHGEVARIELPETELQVLFSDLGLRKEIDAELKKIGFSFVTLDILGYRTGSMNINL